MKGCAPRRRTWVWVAKQYEHQAHAWKASNMQKQCMPYPRVPLQCSRNRRCMHNGNDRTQKDKNWYLAFAAECHPLVRSQELGCQLFKRLGPATQLPIFGTLCNSHRHFRLFVWRAPPAQRRRLKEVAIPIPADHQPAKSYPGACPSVIAAPDCKSQTCSTAQCSVEAHGISFAHHLLVDRRCDAGGRASHLAHRGLQPAVQYDVPVQRG